ncbi:MAG: sulfide/dihydroorotate dehydrogenase-like FAD/NAD-binding protein, partial [Phycisphaerae bacterium]|nr:sulfide/dihydroorotate dehydrogenase-like FAD/NAD-binding protein [Phycisphaerae bacterium]
RRQGQFVIVRAGDGGERIPLTIAEVDPQAGTISLVIQRVGKTTALLTALKAGDSIPDIVGPLGRPTHLEPCAHAVCVGGGVGTAVVYPTAKALVGHGTVVTAIIGGRTKELVILESEMRAFCRDVLVTTDDGSYGRRGLVTDVLGDLLDKASPAVGAVYAVGPVAMMKAVSALTRERAIKTIVSLNPIMVDGTGMCGGCRVSVGGQTRFACVDGPEFDGHQVDFDELADRLTAYRAHEQHALDQCKLGPLTK